MNTVIQIINVSKQYRLGQIGTGTISNDFKRWLFKTFKNEDPFARVGSENTLNIKGGDYVWALKDINMEVKQGEVLGIIGKNGAGKSTLLKILSRVTGPTTGEINIKGRVASLLEVGTGFHPELTGRENIFLNGAILGMTKAEIKNKFDEIVDFSGVEKYIDTPVKRYSSGMYVRLAFAVAAHLDPEILIIDEVLAVGDSEFQKKCLGKMQKVAGQGRTVLFVSHNMYAIKQLCKRCILIKNGNIIANDEPNIITEIYLNDTLIEANVAERKFQDDETKEFQLLTVRLLNNNNEVTQYFNCDEVVSIEFTFKTKCKLPDLYGCISIYDKENLPILSSYSLDINPDCLYFLESGIYKTCINIPPRTLGHGKYSVIMGFASPQSINQTYFTNQYVCSFELNDIKTTVGNKRVGYFSTLLNWNIIKISN
ncbi:MAG: ABC transporter ATP-binding protein [Bacteroidia bacterium]|nr:ABC transporter ATP-binding protein [Bacteroidia bacterium]